MWDHLIAHISHIVTFVDLREYFGGLNIIITNSKDGENYENKTCTVINHNDYVTVRPAIPSKNFISLGFSGLFQCPKIQMKKAFQKKTSSGIYVSLSLSLAVCESHKHTLTLTDTHFTALNPFSCGFF